MLLQKVRVYSTKLDSLDLDNMSTEIHKRMKAGEPVRLSDITEYVTITFGKAVSQETVRRALHKLGLR